MDHLVSRRSVLAAGAAGAGALALAACGSDSGGSSGTSDATRAADPNSTEAAAPPSGSGGAARSSVDSGSGRSPDSSTEGSANSLARLADIPVGQAKAVKLANGKPAIVARTSQNSVACFSAICTHMGCTVAVKGAELDCPCHGSKFNALTGAVLNGPATAPLEKVAVQVSGGDVVTT